MFQVRQIAARSLHEQEM